MRQLGKLLVTKILFYLAKFTLWRFHPEVIAIAGTTNKTTTKDAILAALPTTDSIRANPKSYNTEIGLPLAILSTTSGGSSVFRWGVSVIRAVVAALFAWHFPKLLILEFGIDRAGDMEYLLRIVRPRIVVLTNIIDDSLVDEFSRVLKSLPNDGYAVVNGDDVWIRSIAAQAPCPICFVGVGEKNQLRICDILKYDKGLRATIADNIRQTKTPITIERYGMHHLYAAAAAMAVRQYFNTHMASLCHVK